MSDLPAWAQSADSHGPFGGLGGLPPGILPPGILPPQFTDMLMGMEGHVVPEEVAQKTPRIGLSIWDEDGAGTLMDLETGAPWNMGINQGDEEPIVAVSYGGGPAEDIIAVLDEFEIDGVVGLVAQWGVVIENEDGRRRSQMGRLVAVLDDGDAAKRASEDYEVPLLSRADLAEMWDEFERTLPSPQARQFGHDADPVLMAEFDEANKFLEMMAGAAEMIDKMDRQ